MPAVTASEAPPPVNYVFIDGENVPNLDLSSIIGKTVHVTLLLGPKKANLAVEQVQVLMKHAASAQLIRLEQQGKNALDFTLAYYLGRAVQADPSAYFHLVSKDCDYDPLLKHLNERHIRIYKHDDAASLTFGTPRKEASAANPGGSGNIKPADVLDETLQYLRKRTGKNPKTRKKLTADLKAHHGKEATEAQIERLIERLVKGKHVSFDDKGKATYHLK